MDISSAENKPQDEDHKEINSPEDILFLQLKESVMLGGRVLAFIFVFFVGYLTLFQREAIANLLSFFEIANLTIFFTDLLKEIELTAVVTILVLAITGLYLYLRFFSNINHNDFSDEMGNHLRFYEALSSAFLDVTVLIIMFLYLIFVKHSYVEFLVLFFVLSCLAFCIHKMTLPYQKMIRDYSAIERLNKKLNEYQKMLSITGKITTESFTDSGFYEDLLFYGFMRKNSVWITISLFLTFAVAIVCIIGQFNTISLVVLELAIIRYALFLRKIGSIPPFPLTLYLENAEILNRVFILLENRYYLLTISQNNGIFVIMKSHMRKVEPIIESENT
jgi:hypothetical protein